MDASEGGIREGGDNFRGREITIGIVLFPAGYVEIEGCQLVDRPKKARIYRRQNRHRSSTWRGEPCF